MFDIEHCLRELVAQGGSDLHVKVGAPPLYRQNGELKPLIDDSPLAREDSENGLRALLTDPTKLDEFGSEHEVDFSFEIPGVARFRVNAFRQRGSTSLVCRAIPHKIQTIDQLALPPVIRELAEEERGIILLTGTTGSGKSTTLAAIIDHINTTMSKHIVTIEDPIEFVHSDKRSVINQREVGMDTLSFKRALRRVLRQDPDVILVGEMRDEETVATALSAAETGHLVLSTVHTVDAAESINRLLDFFPPHQHNQARAMIAGTIKGVVSQRLVPSADGGRVATCEILRTTGRVRDMISDPTQTGKLPEVIAEGEYYGMQTFDQALFNHVKSGKVKIEDAMRFATSPHDFKLLVAADGRRGTTMDEVSDTRGSEAQSSLRAGAGAAAGAAGARRPAANAPQAPARPRPQPQGAPADGRPAAPTAAPPGGSPRPSAPSPSQAPRPLQPVASAPPPGPPAAPVPSRPLVSPDANGHPSGAPVPRMAPVAPPDGPAPVPRMAPVAPPDGPGAAPRLDSIPSAPPPYPTYSPSDTSASDAGPPPFSPPPAPASRAPMPPAGEPDDSGVSWLMDDAPAAASDDPSRPPEPPAGPPPLTVA